VQRLTFTVDSKLLRELGERLVGRPYIALAELVKNSYDADASEVVIKFAQDRIEVTDDGHGMSLEDFKRKWLRIGSTHKEREAVSPRLGRPLTGSKGVGRLAVQLVANQLEIRSSVEVPGSEELVAKVDWTEAVDAGDLTAAPVSVGEVVHETHYPRGAPTGTKLILTELNHRWGLQEFEYLAQELWPLQSPFEEPDPEYEFHVKLDSRYQNIVDAFDRQMRAVLDLWTARIVGELLPETAQPPTEPVEVIRTQQPEDQLDDEDWDTASDFSAGTVEEEVPDRIVRLRVEFYEGRTEEIFYRLPHCHLDSLQFEIRVFTLQYRQPKGIKVQEARAYLRRFGGVHVYDTSFHLPYYGPDTDWLHIEIDHSHRLSRSHLLPKALHRPGGLSNLPTNSRLFGAVRVNTAHEQRSAELRYGTSSFALAIQVSRDRLTETAAYRDLVVLVRWALDYYAMSATRRAHERSRPKAKLEEKPSERMKRLQKTLNDVRDDIPDDTFEELSEEVNRAFEETQAEEERYESYLGLLGALATAGISALAYEHEVFKQFEIIEEITELLRLADGNEESARPNLGTIAGELEQWLDRARGTHELFSHLLYAQNRTIRQRFRARETVALIRGQVAAINPGVEISLTGIPEDLYLPAGRYSEWSAIIQNLLVNAFNAMRESTIRHADFTGGRGPEGSWLMIQDTGVGIDPEEAEELFEPFVRRVVLGPDHAARVLGGSGLGLTIVRMMADELGCNVRFVRPDVRHATAVKVTWRD
jgi:signal transduction histidine kinase